MLIYIFNPKVKLHLSEISSSMSMSLAAKPSRLNSGATDRAVTWPCHSSRATEPSAFPMTAETWGKGSGITCGASHLKQGFSGWGLRVFIILFQGRKSQPLIQRLYWSSSHSPDRTVTWTENGFNPNINKSVSTWHHFGLTPGGLLFCGSACKLNQDQAVLRTEQNIDDV